MLPVVTFNFLFCAFMNPVTTLKSQLFYLPGFTQSTQVDQLGGGITLVAATILRTDPLRKTLTGALHGQHMCIPVHVHVHVTIEG